MKCQSPEPPGSAVHGPPGATGSASAHADSLPALFARLQDELLGCLYCVTGNWEDARDALQETFLKCWRNQAKLAEVAHFKAWVFRVALNTGRDARSAAWRRRRQPLEEGAAMLIANHAPPEAAMEAADEVARVRTAVALLRAEEQEVFLLRQSAANFVVSPVKQDFAGSGRFFQRWGRVSRRISRFLTRWGRILRSPVRPSRWGRTGAGGHAGCFSR